MSTEDNKALNQRFYDEVVTGQNYDVIDQIIAPDFVEHEQIPAEGAGRDAVKEAFKMFHAAFPDLKATIDNIVAEGEWVATHCKFSGTHKGGFMGVPPSGKTFSVNVVDFVRIKNGKIAEHWGMMDNASLMQQIGATPAQT